MLLAKTNATTAHPLPSFKPRCSRRVVIAASRRPASSSFFDDPFSLASSLFDDLDREVANLGSRVASEAAELPPAPVRSSALRSSRESEQATERLLPGGRGFARTRSASGRTPTSSWSASESVVVWGVEPPRYGSAAAPAYTPPGLLSLAGGAALLLYAAVAARFARATLEGETKYKKVSRWRLALLWPLLAAFAPEFRGELQGALALKRKEGEEEENDLETKEEAEVSGGGVSSFSSPNGQEKEDAAAVASSSVDR